METAESDKAVGRSVCLPESFWDKIDRLPEGRAAYFRTLIAQDLARRDEKNISADFRVLLDRAAELQIDVKTVLHTAIIEEQCSSLPRAATA